MPHKVKALVETCRAAGRRTLHIERAEELVPADFVGTNTVGLTAGTSTLSETVEAVIERLRVISDSVSTTKTKT